MNKYWFSFLFVVLVMGCQPQVVDVTGTPTATIPPLKGEPIPVDLSALAANPTVYENAYIQLTGQYTHQPRLVCESQPHPSPVTWGLSSDTLLALAGGFDEQLRPLLPPGLTMTVAGRWQHWQGPVGCGDTTQTKDLWYLQVTEIISPSPLALVTLTPGGAPPAALEGTPVVEGTPIAQIDPTRPVNDEGTAVIPTQQPPISEPTESSIRATPEPGRTVNAEVTTAVTSDPRFSPTPTDEFTRSTATPNGTTTLTPTPSRTPLGGATTTAGPTPTTNRLTTSTPAPSTEKRGAAELEVPHMDFLDTNESHSWTFNNEIANNNLSIQVVPSAQSDLIITVFNPSGAQIKNLNNTGTGVMESIIDLALPAEGNYEIIITDNNKIGGDYAIIFLDDFSVRISFFQIDYGVPQNTSFTQEEEQLWFFDGNAGDAITITADPTAGEPDIGFEFIGPLSEPLKYVDELFESGEPEVLDGYLLNKTGLYGIWLFGFGASTVNVQLSVRN